MNTDVNLTYNYTEDVTFGVSLGWFVPGDVFTEGQAIQPARPLPIWSEVLILARSVAVFQNPRSILNGGFFIMYSVSCEPFLAAIFKIHRR